MMRRPVVLLALLVSGCAHFHPQPISPEETATAFDARSLSDAGLAQFLAQHPLPAPDLDWNLDRLTLVAFYYQPELAMARADWEVALAATRTAGERPNPALTLSPEYDTTTTPNWIFGAALDVAFETAGKRGYRTAQAWHLADAARWKLWGAAWQVRGRVRAGLVDLYSARETRKLLASEEAAQSRVVTLLQGQLEAGNISAYEATAARVALQNIRLALQDAETRETEARATLADALGLPMRALDQVSLDFGGLDRFPADLTAPEVRRAATLNRTDIRAALAEYAASQRALQLELARQYPDINLGPGYTRDQADDKWALGLTLDLPVFNQNQGPIAEARAQRQKAAANFLAVQAAAINEIDRALAVYAAAVRHSATATALQQDLEKRMDSVRAMQQAGEMDPLAVANARIEYYSGALARLDALVKTQQALGQLQDAVQSPLVLPDTMLKTTEPDSMNKAPNPEK